MANKTYTEVLDTMVPWTEEYRDQFQEEIRYGEHRAVCALLGIDIVMPDPIKYPTVPMAYAPVDECANRNLPSSGNKPVVTPFSLKVIAFLVSMLAVKLWM